MPLVCKFFLSVAEHSFITSETKTGQKERKGCGALVFFKDNISTCVGLRNRDGAIVKAQEGRYDLCARGACASGSNRSEGNS